MRVLALPLVVGLFAQWTTGSYVQGKQFVKHSIHFMSLKNNYPSKEVLDDKEVILFTPFLEKNLDGFKEALAFKESQGRYTVINRYGYIGKYQFGKGTLKLIGIHNADKFAKDPALQERAFLANLSRNKWILRKDIKSSAKKYINGVLITESGILAAAHLVGPGAVKKFLRSSGKKTFSDGFGTTIEEYMQKFKSFDVSIIKGDRKAKA